MSDLDTVAEIVAAFYRLVGTVSSDGELVARGEAVDDVAYQSLTRGCRKAQRWMIDNGYSGWRTRTANLIPSLLGTDEADGGRYVEFSTVAPDLLKVYGKRRQQRSGLVEPGGRRWGGEILADQDHIRGDHYYVKGEQLWLARNAEPPNPLFMDYHTRHDEWDANATIDFPLEARGLIHTEAAAIAMSDNWLPGGNELEAKISRALSHAQNEARAVARQTKEPRRFRKPNRFGNRW